MKQMLMSDSHNLYTNLPLNFGPDLYAKGLLLNLKDTLSKQGYPLCCKKFTQNKMTGTNEDLEAIKSLDIAARAVALKVQEVKELVAENPTNFKVQLRILFSWNGIKKRLLQKIFIYNQTVQGFFRPIMLITRTEKFYPEELAKIFDLSFSSKQTQKKYSTQNIPAVGALYELALQKKLTQLSLPVMETCLKKHFKISRPSKNVEGATELLVGALIQHFFSEEARKQTKKEEEEAQRKAKKEEETKQEEEEAKKKEQKATKGKTYYYLTLDDVVNELDIHLLENNKLVSAHKFFGEPVQLCSQWTEYPKDHLVASRMEPQKKVVGPILSQIHELCDSPKQVGYQ